MTPDTPDQRGQPTEQELAELRGAGWIIEPPSQRPTQYCPRCTLYHASLYGKPWARAKGKRTGFCLPCALSYTRIARAVFPETANRARRR